MPTKLKTIKLTHPWRNPAANIGTNEMYRVEQCANSTEYAPGQMLPKAEVDILCEAKGWHVTIGPVK